MLLQLDWILKQTAEVKIQPSNGDSLIFRIELYEQSMTDASRRFRFRVFRYDAFRLRPLQPPSFDAPADHDILIVDSLFDGDEVSAKNEADAWDHFLQKMQQQFTLG